MGSWFHRLWTKPCRNGYYDPQRNNSKQLAFLFFLAEFDPIFALQHKNAQNRAAVDLSCLAVGGARFRPRRCLSFYRLKRSQKQKAGKRQACGMTYLARSFVVSTSWVSQVDTSKKTWQYFGRWRAISSLSRMHKSVFFAQIPIFAGVNIEGGNWFWYRGGQCKPLNYSSCSLARLFIWKKLVKNPGKTDISHTIHGTGIFTYIWLILYGKSR